MELAKTFLRVPRVQLWRSSLLILWMGLLFPWFFFGVCGIPWALLVFGFIAQVRRMVRFLYTCFVSSGGEEEEILQRFRSRLHGIRRQVMFFRSSR